MWGEGQLFCLRVAFASFICVRPLARRPMVACAVACSHSVAVRYGLDRDGGTDHQSSIIA